VVLTLKDGKEQRQHFTPAIWKKNDKTLTVVVNDTAKPVSVKLDGGIFMDATPADNSMNL
jgi:hypothetical protein